jgi:hypothetical protein
MSKSPSSFFWAAVVACVVSAAPSVVVAVTPWQAYADCAAGYLANWQDRLADPSRSKQMADTIRSQSKDYETAAARRYAEQKGAGKAEAAKAVHAYVEANVARFVAMDKKGQLIQFIDACPQPGEGN